jgi:hypothetical protein
MTFRLKYPCFQTIKDLFLLIHILIPSPPPIKAWEHHLRSDAQKFKNGHDI